MLIVEAVLLFRGVSAEGLFVSPVRGSLEPGCETP
jgi:hypothetical protein